MDHQSLPSVISPAWIGKRDIKKVPFVELYNGRLQGVISSGSDIKRVYVAYFEAKTMNYYCSTNNNRPCGGLRGRPCKHLQALFMQSIVQFSRETVTNFLKIPDDQSLSDDALTLLSHAGQPTAIKDNGEIFSRFLSYLALLELPASDTTLPEMAWFVE